MTSQIYPPTDFSYSLEDEARRLLYILNRLTTQEYRTRGFFFLPTLPKIAQERAVVIPSVAYNTIPNLWERVQGLASTTPMTGPKDLLASLRELLVGEFLDKDYQQAHTRITKEWDLVYREFFDTLYKILPQYKSSPRSINIILTSCGTSCTFSLVDEKTRDLTIYLRLDQGALAIAEAIVTALIRPHLQFDLNYTWEEIESTVDFLLRDTILGKSIPKSSLGTIAHLRKSQLGKLQDQSRRYIQSLTTSDFSLWSRQAGDFYYGGQKLADLTPKQQILLEVMLAKRGQTVTYDELATSLWPSGEDFSLWAIVKELSRLRQSLVEQGLPPNLIHAHRKVGYSLT